MEKQIGNEGRLLQKTLKGTDLKFNIIPPKKEKEDSWLEKPIVLVLSSLLIIILVKYTIYYRLVCEWNVYLFSMLIWGSQ